MRFSSAQFSDTVNIFCLLLPTMNNRAYNIRCTKEKFTGLAHILQSMVTFNPQGELIDMCTFELIQIKVDLILTSTLKCYNLPVKRNISYYMLFHTYNIHTYSIFPCHITSQNILL